MIRVADAVEKLRDLSLMSGPEGSYYRQAFATVEAELARLRALEDVATRLERPAPDLTAHADAIAAEAARMEAVTPTTDPLDAAVEEARMNVVAWGPDPARDSRSVAMGEEVDALIAAVEACAVARREAGEMQHPDTERFRVLTLHLLRHMTIADIDVFEEAVAEAGGEEPTDDHLVSAARVAVDALRLREDSPSSERLTEWGA